MPGFSRVAIASSRPGLDATNCQKGNNPYCSWETRFMHRFGGFASITMPQPLAYETFKCHFIEASSGDEDEVGSVDTTKGYLDNACKFFTSAKKHFEDIKKLGIR